ncbi:hypothetical protein EV192_109262 [Actinocrispum wychmicini]|uniref:Uncharacterized protein n=1 Tax=Actinocrispum wychmicini TaxID=1213861 RepID=A0A4R2J942_9PSEU|nr:hypothetical protein EV192_109262 [Actinocrispum wychmicini]
MVCTSQLRPEDLAVAGSPRGGQLGRAPLLAAHRSLPAAAHCRPLPAAAARRPLSAAARRLLPPPTAHCPPLLLLTGRCPLPDRSFPFARPFSARRKDE